MDPITAGISVTIFALFTFFSILISSFVSKDTLKENKRIIISSFFLLIAIMAINFDLTVFKNDVSTILWQFLIAFSFTMSTFLLVNEIKILYVKVTNLNMLHILLISTLLVWTHGTCDVVRVIFCQFYRIWITYIVTLSIFNVFY